MEKALISIGRKDLNEMIQGRKRGRTELSFLQHKLCVQCGRAERNSQKMQIEALPGR